MRLDSAITVLLWTPNPISLVPCLRYLWSGSLLSLNLLFKRELLRGLLTKNSHRSGGPEATLYSVCVEEGYLRQLYISWCDLLEGIQTGESENLSVPTVQR